MNHFGLGMGYSRFAFIVSGFNNTVDRVIIDGDYIYCSGAFTAYKSTAIGCIAKISLATGELDATFDSGSGFDSTLARVSSMILSGSYLYCAGDFTTYQGTTRQRIARISASTAALDATFNSASGFSGTVKDIVLSGSDLYVGGDFTSFKGTSRKYIAKISASTAALDSTFDAATGFDSSPYCLALSGSDLYVGGTFTTYKTIPRLKIAKLSASTAALDATFDASTGFNAAALGMVVSGSDLYVGGQFTTYKGTTRLRIAKLSASTADLDATFNTATGYDNTVVHIALSDSSLLCSGYFTTYKGTTRQGIAKISASTAALDATFNTASGFDNAPGYQVIHGSDLYVCGSFTYYKQQAHEYLVRMSATDASLN